MSFISYRNREYVPQDVYVDGIKAGRVEFEGDGWGAFSLDGDRLGFGTHKSNAGRIIAEFIMPSLEAGGKPWRGIDDYVAAQASGSADSVG